MQENIEERTREGLLNLYTEATQAGADLLAKEAWEDLLELDRKMVKERLTALRDELNFYAHQQ